MDAYDIVYLGLFGVLIFVTIFYAIQTKKLVRDNPKPLVYAFDPGDDEWQEDIDRVKVEARPKSKYLRVKTLLINPGIVPIILEKVSEELTAGDSKVEAKKTLIQPIIPSSERHALYVFTDIWVILHDDFAIWYRIYELEDTAGTEYGLKLTFHFRIGDKEKKETKKLPLNPHNI